MNNGRRQTADSVVEVRSEGNTRPLGVASNEGLDAALRSQIGSSGREQEAAQIIFLSGHLRCSGFERGEVLRIAGASGAHPTCGGFMSEKNDKHASNYHELSGREGIEKIAGIVKGIRICMFSTVSETGYAISRPMATQDVAFDGTVYFLTRSTSEKVGNIAENQHVTLDYADPGDSKYVTLRGRASVYRDQAKIDEMWNPMYKAWFPEGKEDPEIAVVRVEVAEGEYWEANSSNIVMGIKYVAAAVTGGKVPVGEAGHLDVA